MNVIPKKNNEEYDEKKKIIDALNKIFYLTISINDVFSSSLNLRLQNDIVCGLIADVFKEISCISILIYNANKNSLVNIGHYLNPEKSKAQFNTFSKKYEKIIKNKPLYDYIVHKSFINEITKISYSDFLSFSRYQKNTIFLNDNYDHFNEPSFKQFCNNEISFSENGNTVNEIETYLEYNKKIANRDIHPLDNEITRSAHIFKEYSKNPKSHKDSFDIALADDLNKIVCNIYAEELHTIIDTESSYISIPLIVDNNCIGVIRILLESTYNEVIGKIILPENAEYRKGFINKIHGREFQSLVSLISAHISNSYPPYSYSFKSLPNIEEGYFDTINHSDKNQNKLSDFCDSLRHRINCRACIIRFTSEEHSLPFILGWTRNVQDYVRSIYDTDHFRQFHNELEEIFYFNKTTTENNLDLIGIQFTVGFNGIENINYVYSYGSDLLNITNDANDIDKRHDMVNKISTIFNKDVNQKLKDDIKARNILIIKIPYVKNGYVTFCNTQYRAFTKKDVDIAYTHINRLGSVLRIRQEGEKEIKSIKVDAIVRSLGQLKHGISPGINKIIEYKDLIDAEIQKIQKLAKTYIDERVLENVEKHIDSCKGFINQIGVGIKNIFLSIYVFDFAEHEEKATLIIYYDFGDWLEETINRRINDINYPILFNLDRKIKVNFNQSILQKIIYILIDNAMKYCYSFEERMKTNYFNKDKPCYFITVNFYNDGNDNFLEVIYWGHEIPLDEKEEVFELDYHSSHDGIDNSKIPIGGLGLFNAKTLAKKLKMDISCDPVGCETKMTIKWN